MTQPEVLAMIADHSAKVRPHYPASQAMTGGNELRAMADDLTALHYRSPFSVRRIEHLRELAHEFDRMERELNRRFQEEREAHAAMEGLKT
jgi:hypothetical protein